MEPKVMKRAEYNSYTKLGGFLIFFIVCCVINIVSLTSQIPLYDWSYATFDIGIILSLDMFRVLLYTLSAFLLLSKTRIALIIIRIIMITEFTIFICETLYIAGMYGIHTKVSGVSFMWFLYFIFSRRANVYFNNNKYINRKFIIVDSEIVPKEDKPKIYPCVICGTPIDTVNLICPLCGKEYRRKTKEENSTQ